MMERTNEARARLARDAVAHHAFRIGAADEPLSTQITGLLVGIRHLCETEGHSYPQIDGRARHDFAAVVVTPVEQSSTSYLPDKSSTDEKVAIILSYDMRVSTRDEFLNATDRPEGLLERAQGTRDGDKDNDLTVFNHVIWDPLGDDDSWMLWGDDLNELLDYTIGPDGPLTSGDHSYHVNQRKEA